jgi:hypothetical protein
MLNGTSLGSRLISIVVLINIVVLVIVGVLAFTSSNSALRTRALVEFETRQQEAVKLVNTLTKQIYETATQYTASVADFPDILDSNALRSFTHKSVMNDTDTNIYRISLQRPDLSVAVLNIPTPLVPTNVEWRIYRYETEMPANAPFAQCARHTKSRLVLSGQRPV